MASNYVQLEYLNQLIKELEFGEMDVKFVVHESAITGIEIRETKKLKFNIEPSGVKLVLSATHYVEKMPFDSRSKKIDNKS